MNSSTGFKKRSLLRPPSGLLSNARDFLKVVDISQSEPIIASNIRTQVAAIQQQINVLDKDKRIRAGESSLEKNYVLNLKKWVRQAQIIGQKEDEDTKILKQMGVDSYEAGFRKLWKVTGHLDLIIAKITELQAVQFLKYDEMFESLAEDSANGQRMLQAISKGGFAPSSFHLSQLALQRQIELFELVSELKRANISNGQNMSSSKGFGNKQKDETGQLIEQLRGENKKLTELLDQIQSSQKAAQNKQKFVKIEEKVYVSASSPKQVFIELEGKYKTQISDLHEMINKLSSDLSQSKIKCSQLETRLKAGEEVNKQASTYKKPASGSYQEALLEQMDKMKKGYERKIKKILEDFEIKERDMRKKEYEFKNENQKLKWEKGLLLKKFEALTATAV